MVRRISLTLAIVGCFLSGLTAVRAETFTFRSEYVLGTSFEMIVSTRDQATAARAHAMALGEIERLEQILSTWQRETEISNLNMSDGGVVSQELFDVLSLCEGFLTSTKNALSCRIGDVVDTWREAAKTGVSPLPVAMNKRAADISAADVALDPQNTSVGRPSSVSFIVDGLAKGWIIDQTVEKIVSSLPSIHGVMINIGGDIRAYGDATIPQYRIGIAEKGGASETLSEVIRVQNAAIASSGNGARDLMAGEATYSHIISPRTGMPQSKMSRATCVAPDAMTADALATAFMVMGVGEALEYANTREGVEAVLTTKGGARFASNGWSDLLVPIDQIISNREVEDPWADGYAFSVRYTIPPQDVSEYEYPYIVIWVTDLEKNLVRSLQLLGRVPVWVEENYVFWRRYGRKQPAIVDTVAEPTRPPGTYTVIWDGRDGNGHPVPTGRYVIHVEASREHGGHQYEKKEFLIGGRPFLEVIEPGNELGRIEFQFGPAND